MRSVGACLAAGIVLVAGCRESAPLPEAPTPTPAPSVTSGGRAIVEPDGRVLYRLVVRADAGVAFFPLSVSALVGTGALAWTRRTEAAFAFDAAANRFVPTSTGETREEWVNAVFPGASQEVSLPVRYAGPVPAEERFEVVYATLPLPELASRVYVKSARTPAGLAGEAVPREPLGARVREVDVSRWLASGFFVDGGAPRERHVVTVPGPEAR